MGRTSLDSLVTFVSVARAGSISAAAADLGSTQSTVSDQITSLERSLGYRLFERSSRGVVLTTRGRQLMARVGAQIDAAVSAVEATRGEPAARETILLGGPAEFVSEVVLPHVTRVAPDLTLRVEFGEAEPLLETLTTGGLDVMISAIQPRVAGVEFRPFFDEQFVLLMTPDRAEDFATRPETVPLLAYAEELPIIRRYWRTVFRRRPTDLTIAAVVPDLRVLGALAAQGRGMTVLPHYLAEPYLRSGRLVDPVQPPEPPLNTLYVARRRARPGRAPRTDRLAELVDEAARVFSDRVD